MPDTHTLIIGAGPAGLAVAGRLSRLGIPYIILEKGTHVGQSWYSHYDRLSLHTVKEHSDLPHRPMPKEYPVYVPKNDLIAYWENYAREMNIQPIFGAEVTSVQRRGEQWLTQAGEQSWVSENVVVATGYNRVPYEPVWPGQDAYEGVFLHSKDYRNGAPFKGKKVLLIGIGNTGAELALDLWENGALPSIAVRSPVNFIQRDILGRPAQLTAIMLGKTPPWFSAFASRLVQRLIIGDLRPYGLKPSPYAPSEQLRLQGKVPIIDLGTLPLIKQGKVKIVPDVRAFTPEGVTYADGREESFDAVIACTGYRARMEDFVENGAVLLNERGYPRSMWFDDPAWKGFYCCGFTLPLTGILRNIKSDSGEIVAHIAGVRDGVRAG